VSKLNKFSRQRRTTAYSTVYIGEFSSAFNNWYYIFINLYSGVADVPIIAHSLTFDERDLHLKVIYRHSSVGEVIEYIQTPVGPHVRAAHYVDGVQYSCI